MLGKSGSGFDLGTSLLSLGNTNTGALSDSKCILSIIHIPAILTNCDKEEKLGSGSAKSKFLNEIVSTVIDNLEDSNEDEKDVSISDLQFVVNMSQTTTQN